MKKHDEGYVLAYVTVVLLLFCLIATMILTGAMKNLTIQQDTVQHMKDRYAAEGMIQQVIAQIQIGVTPAEEHIEYADDGITIISMITAQKVRDGWELVSSSGTVQITCTVDSSGKYQSFDIGTAPEQSKAGEGEVSR
jgi:hypothetical protein